MPLTPKFYRLEEWYLYASMGRSSTYRAIAAGKLKAVKNGSRLLIDAESGEEFLNSLPRAEIKPDRKVAA